MTAPMYDKRQYRVHTYANKFLDSKHWTYYKSADEQMFPDPESAILHMRCKSRPNCIFKVCKLEVVEIPFDDSIEIEFEKDKYTIHSHWWREAFISQLGINKQRWGMRENFDISPRPKK